MSQIRNNNNSHGYNNNGWSNASTNVIENGENNLHQQQQQHFPSFSATGHSLQQVPPHYHQQPQQQQHHQFQQQHQHQNYPPSQQSELCHQHHRFGPPATTNNINPPPQAGTHNNAASTNGGNNSSNSSNHLHRFPDPPPLQQQPPAPAPPTPISQQQQQPQLQAHQAPPIPMQRLTAATADSSSIPIRPRMNVITAVQPPLPATTTTTNNNHEAGSNPSHNHNHHQHHHHQQHHYYQHPPPVNTNNENSYSHHKTMNHINDGTTTNVEKRQLQMENEMLKRRLQQLESELANTKRLLLNAEMNNSNRARKRPKLPMASSMTTATLVENNTNNNNSHGDTDHHHDNNRHNHHNQITLTFPDNHHQMFMASTAANDGEADDNDTNSLSGPDIDNATERSTTNTTAALIDQRSPLRLGQNSLTRESNTHHSSSRSPSGRSYSSSKDRRISHRSSPTNSNDIHLQQRSGPIVDGRKHRHNAMFANSCNLLREYKAKHGHCNVPRRDGFLGEFVMKQRAQYKKYNKGEQTPMDAERVRILEEIGLQWSSSYFDVWDEQFERLKRIKEEYGHCCAKAITKLADDKRHQELVRWMADQKIMLKRIRDWEKVHNRPMTDMDRRKGKNMTMTVERQHKLESLGCMYLLASCDKELSSGSTSPSPQQDASEKNQKGGDRCLHTSRNILSWFSFFEESREYIATHGTLNPPFSKSGLSAWIRAQRKNYKELKDGQYSDGVDVAKLRVQLLNSIGFPWEPPAKKTKNSSKETE